MRQVVWVHKLKNEKEFPVQVPTKMFKKYGLSLMESYMTNFVLRRH